MKWPLKKKLTGLSFWGGFALLLAIIWMSYKSTQELINANEWVTHTQQVLLNLEHLLSNVKDTESAARHYVLSGTPDDLVLMHQAKLQINQEMKILRNLTVDNPHQQKRLQDIAPLLANKLAWADKMVRVRQIRGFLGVWPMARNGEGAVLMGPLRDTVSRMEQEEFQLLQLRQEKVRSSAQRTAVTLALGMLLIFILILSAFHTLGREIDLRGKTEMALRENEERIRLVVDVVKDYAIISLDPSGHVTSWNQGAERIKGYTEEDILGQSMKRFYTQEDLQREKPDALLRRAVKEGRVEDEGWRLRKDGSTFWADVVITPIRNDAGVLLGFSKITQDLTARKKIEDDLRHLNASLEQQTVALTAVNKELEAFSYSVSHDLRTPLRALDGYSQELLRNLGDKLDVQSQQDLNRIRAAAGRMGQLIDDLLDLSRLTRVAMVKEEVNLSTMAGKILQELQSAAPDRQAEFVIAPNLTVTGDPKLLHIALQNLLGNAWKFTGKKPVTQIGLGLIELEGKKVFFIKDNGAGFDMAYMGKLFGAFQRLHDTGEFAGTGIGLATVQRIIHRHGGKIWAEAKVNEGATFFVSLPSL